MSTFAISAQVCTMIRATWFQLEPPSPRQANKAAGSAWHFLHRYALNHAQGYMVSIGTTLTPSGKQGSRLCLAFPSSSSSQPPQAQTCRGRRPGRQPAATHSSRGGPCVGSSLKRFLHSTRSRENLSSGEKRAGCALCVGVPSGASFCARQGLRAQPKQLLLY